MRSTSSQGARAPGQNAGFPNSRDGEVGSLPSASLRTAVLALPAEATDVGVARHWATGVLTLWGLSEQDCSVAAMVIGELAANAALYGQSEMTVRLAQEHDLLRVCVTDSGARGGHSLRREPGEHGRGLAIVRALADSMEVTREPGGWRVGAVLRVTMAGTHQRGSRACVA